MHESSLLPAGFVFLVLAACSRGASREPPQDAARPEPSSGPSATLEAPVVSSAASAAPPPAPCEDLVQPKPTRPLGLPRTEKVRGVDVSVLAPWKTLRDAGFAFAFAGATHGLSKNASFSANWAMMKRCELPRGAYHFLTEKADGAAQARAFLEQLDGDPGELPPVVDIEKPNCAGDCCALSCTDWTRLATAFVDTVTTRLSRKPMVYMVEPFFSQCLCGTLKLKSHPLWLAGWPKFDFPEKVRTGGFGRWTFYQHAGNVIVGGVAVDLNLFRGDAAELERFLAGSEWIATDP